MGGLEGWPAEGRRTGGGGGWGRVVRQGVTEHAGHGWRRQTVRPVQDRAVHADVQRCTRGCTEMYAWMYRRVGLVKFIFASFNSCSNSILLSWRQAGQACSFGRRHMSHVRSLSLGN